MDNYINHTSLSISYYGIGGTGNSGFDCLKFFINYYLLKAIGYSSPYVYCVCNAYAFYKASFNC